MSCWQLLWRTLISQMVMRKSLPLLQRIPPQLLVILLSHMGRLGTFGRFTCCMTPNTNILIIVKMRIAHFALQIYQSRDAPHLVSRDTCNLGIVNSLSQLMIRPVLALKLRGSDLFHIYPANCTISLQTESTVEKDLAPRSYSKMSSRGGGHLIAC